MNARPKIIGVIPARFDSQRLPGKVLLPIGPKPMVQWVYERARLSPLLDALVVATDSDEVIRHCSSLGIPVVRTGRHPSGSDRVHEVMERTDGDIYVNIQGDEPTLRADHVDLLVRPILEGESEVTTLKVAAGGDAAMDPDCVKVVTDKRGRALYFSRSAIPFRREAQGAPSFYKHIGIYGYTRAALDLFHRWPPSPLELAEKLEQLRFLENGMPIRVMETPYDTIGVDTRADLERAAAFLLQEGA